MLSLDTGSEVQYYHHDALGSTVNLTTDSGSVKVSYWIDPFGAIRKQEGSSVNRQIFTGQEHDEKTGLVYFGARYYDPDTARFITQDSYLGESGTPPSLHRYLYAYSNPTVYVDLYGYWAWSLVQPSVNSETDIFGPTPVRNSGNQYLDEAWAGLDIVLAAPKYIVNAASAIASTPTIGYAKAKDISVQKADEEIAGYMASSGPLAPYLLTGTAPFRVGSTLGYSARVLRAEAKAARKTATKITKELKNDAVEMAYEAVETVGQKSGAIKYAVPPNEPGLRKTVIRRRAGQPDARIDNVKKSSSQIDKSGDSSDLMKGRLGPKGVDPNHHNANVMLKDADGNVLHHERIVSGNMTPDEKVLGFPKNTLASHTEARAVTNIPLEKGQKMTITGQKPPCPSCKGYMNRASKDSGATIKYQWRQNGKSQRCKANQ